MQKGQIIMINIGNKREVFWDDHLVDTEKTTASRHLMHPDFKETGFFLEAGEEALMLMSILKDDKGYKLYYIKWDVEDTNERYLAVVESADGLNWKKPDLNMFDHPELEHNNVVMDGADCAFVFYDTNPDCKPEEKYKIVTPYYNNIDGVNHLELWAYVSADGYNFTLSHALADDTKGHYDSLNTAHFRDGRYACYFRYEEWFIRI